MKIIIKDEIFFVHVQVILMKNDDGTYREIQFDQLCNPDYNDLHFLCSISNFSENVCFFRISPDLDSWSVVKFHLHYNKHKGDTDSQKSYAYDVDSTEFELIINEHCDTIKEEISECLEQWLEQ